MSSHFLFGWFCFFLHPQTFRPRTLSVMVSTYSVATCCVINHLVRAPLLSVRLTTTPSLLPSWLIFWSGPVSLNLLTPVKVYTFKRWTKILMKHLLNYSIVSLLLVSGLIQTLTKQTYFAVQYFYTTIHLKSMVVLCISKNKAFCGDLFHLV